MVAHVPEIVAAFGRLDITVVRPQAQEYNDPPPGPSRMRADDDRIFSAALHGCRAEQGPDIIAKIKRVIEADLSFYRKVLMAVLDFTESCRSALAKYEEQKGMRYGGLQLGPMRESSPVFYVRQTSQCVQPHSLSAEVM
jgi:hypothetical protein